MRPIVLDICRKMGEHRRTSNNSKEKVREVRSPDVSQITPLPPAHEINIC